MTIGKVGMYGGKFVPVHLGHVYSMIKASTMVDELHIIVSYDTDYEKQVIFKDAKLRHIPYTYRVRWWSELTKDLPHVRVHAIEEKQTGNFADWEKGAEQIKAVIQKDINIVFSSEVSYSNYFDILYPEAKHIILDSERQTYPISATAFREEGAIKHWDMLPRIVQPYFAKKVVVVGTESCGKSTLVRHLATLFNTVYVEEIGRTYYERLGDCENVTLPTDYPEIAIEHKYHEKRQLEKANKVLFVDTEAIVTQYFSQLYLNTQHSVLDEFVKIQDYDLWLFLEPDVKWVDDGTRSFGEQEIREKNNQLLKQLLADYGVKYEIIKGNYEERLTTALGLVRELLES